MSENSNEELNDNQQTAKDVSYSPASERETEQKQNDQHAPADVDATQIKTLPGTGGPDDGGDIEVDPADIHIPGRSAE